MCTCKHAYINTQMEDLLLTTESTEPFVSGILVRIFKAYSFVSFTWVICCSVCCSVLQCVAVCCSVLQCVPVCCSVLQRVAVRCSVLLERISKSHSSESST